MNTAQTVEPAARPERVEGRLAKRPYQPGDPLPAVGSECLVSGANCDIESDQHRGYSWRRVIGYSVGDVFVCLQTRDCWPTVERLQNCWFAEVPIPRSDPAAAGETSLTVNSAWNDVRKQAVAVAGPRGLGSLLAAVHNYGAACARAALATQASAPQVVEPAVLVPVVMRYSGGASAEGYAGRVWLRLEDGGPDVEYVRAAPNTEVPFPATFGYISGRPFYTEAQLLSYADARVKERHAHASAPNGARDSRALEAARRIEAEHGNPNQVQRQARIQCEVLSAMEWQASAPSVQVVPEAAADALKLMTDLSAEPDWVRGRRAAQPVAPAGWKLLPPKLTGEMRVAFVKAALDYMRAYGSNSPEAMYEAAFEAAPEPEQRP